MSTSLRQFPAPNITPGVSLRPQMLQSLKMLAMTALELEMALKQEIYENPVLELDDDWDDDTDTNVTEISDSASVAEISDFSTVAAISDRHLPVAETSDSSTVAETSDSSPVAEISDFSTANEPYKELKQTLEEAKELSDVLDSWNEYHTEYSSRTEHSSSENEQQFEKYIEAEENFKQDYLNQFDKFYFTDNEYNFIYDLVDSCNAYGFLPRTIDKENNIDEEFNIYTLAKDNKINKKKADELHKIVLNALPQGITARSISESLYYQLEEYEKNDDLLTGIILDDFNDLIHKRFQQIAKKYGVTEDDVLYCREKISRLDPKPGLRITGGKPQYIMPDIILTKIGDKFEIIINDFNIPKISLSRRYYDILKEMGRDKAAVNYVKDKINSAKFLIKSVFMRHKTLERVMRSIINHQREYFYHNGSLSPLNYATIANELGVNESTVSRVVKSKYVETHKGMFCLKDYFCTNAGKDKDYDSVSKQNVKQQILELIENEDKSAPISDQDIVYILKERGIGVSRRVIAKYRDAMNIPNSRNR